MLRIRGEGHQRHVQLSTLVSFLFALVMYVSFEFLKRSIIVVHHKDPSSIPNNIRMVYASVSLTKQPLHFFCPLVYLGVSSTDSVSSRKSIILPHQFSCSTYVSQTCVCGKLLPTDLSGNQTSYLIYYRATCLPGNAFSDIFWDQSRPVEIRLSTSAVSLTEPTLDRLCKKVLGSSLLIALSFYASDILSIPNLIFSAWRFRKGLQMRELMTETHLLFQVKDSNTKENTAITVL